MMNKIHRIFQALIRQTYDRDGRAIAQAVSRWLPTTVARVQPGSSHLGFVVEKVVLGQVFSE
jgi:hypothetical protein